ncbi:hypothetical protein VSH64_24930 [Amycolatopsis rhabdoformis]|uniref:Uncharacterized protein n=1 Tax=Amycolatopsis rhabdoformis TaxID=1448059 RepID=A0ABZ1HXL8_9PSEU|nr:hypothetical protein [Amycolatopsis rhabdoformis]WSE26123.1 hypothetical protein VSH64_24930 [Amycolatopsis rhabdoformis]
MDDLESLRPMQDAINRMHEDIALARDIMAPVRPCTARRLGLHRPCPCMAYPQRFILGHDPAVVADEVVRVWQNAAGLSRIMALPEPEISFTRPTRCDGTCPMASP